MDQAELEKFDGVSQGKYTIGLGQTKMSFCDDREGKRNIAGFGSTLKLTRDIIQIYIPSLLRLFQPFLANTP